MMTPEVAGVSTFFAVILKDVAVALVRRRNGNSVSKLGERIALLEAQVKDNSREILWLRNRREDDRPG